MKVSGTNINLTLSYATLEEFESTYNNPNVFNQLNAVRCSCGQYMEMNPETVTVDIATYHFEIVGCPILKCSCGHRQLCPDIPQEVYMSYFKLMENGCNTCRLTMNSDIKYEFAKNLDFKYDSRDLSIPGLGVDADPTNPKGFSCPVFFDRKVLYNFFFDENYELDFACESYGTIAKVGTDGWPYEWKIVFGINSNNKVVMFLGDLDQIDSHDKSAFWLKSYNVESDHCLIDAELYRAQIQCIFSDPIVEKRILSLRNLFFKKISEKYGINLFHLENEVEIKGKSIQKPINYSEQELKENIITLDGLLNEGINCEELRNLYAQIISPPPQNLKSLKTRKLLQGIIAHYSNEEDAKQIISPLFYLNDLRVCFAHLIPQEEVDSCKATIMEAFGLASFTEYQKLYTILLDKLYYLYRYLNIIEI